ncbi:hypothetical protein NIES4071_18570 [Calothrix sp. NIES-4071]|nr:hypothetical protein NIES4071_18570 [Calothrix sp. NIES-4071]BAZ56190.1 hypothetical protein NIES4105_18520 [Calothrix sp. NIES-4105]
MPDPDKNIIKIDPLTVVVILAVLILAPLLLTGFLGQ